ncbi:hypothetical protein BJ742DRAFT_853842 [Cladochytrium replicatum]|nr:hypothetical protein BJ742DRAFT_853842 [Cladochytrium replicatum]
MEHTQFGGASGSAARTRKTKVSYFYHNDIGHFHYAQGHEMKPARIKLTHNLITSYKLHNKLEVCTPQKASFNDLTRFHSDDYIDFLKRVTPYDSYMIAKHGRRFNMTETTDCPVFDGLYELCSISAGGSIHGAGKLNRGESDIAVWWGGGLHHAKKSGASGFCYVNDIVLGILELLRVHQRVLYVDIDVHHGDGVEEAFYTTDRVMTCSFHKHGDFFPGTGYVEDIGAGKGRHYSVNVPLMDGVDDECFVDLVKSVLGAVMERFRPGAVVLQCGADSLSGDRLGCFNLSMRGHAFALEYLKTWNVPILMLGGGGYTIRNVSKTWCYETGIAAGIELPEDLPFSDYVEYFGPEFKLNVAPSNMQNANTPKSIKETKRLVLESLRYVVHAPSVQMQPTFADLPSSDDEQVEDPDVRISERASNAYRIPDNAYSDSEDEEEDNRTRRHRRSYKIAEPKRTEAATASATQRPHLTRVSSTELLQRSLVGARPRGKNGSRFKTEVGASVDVEMGEEGVDSPPSLRAGSDDGGDSQDPVLDSQEVDMGEGMT